MKPWKWETINSIGTTKFAQSSFVFLFSVPVLVRFFDESKYSAVFDFELPFSWTVLYFMSMCVGLSTTLYFWRCPDLVKRYKNYGAFQIEGRGIPYLMSELRACLKNSSNAISLKELFELVDEQFANDIYLSPNRLNASRIENEPNPLDMQLVYLMCRDVANSTYPSVRTLATLSYITGFTMFAWVVAENLFYVLKHLS